MPDLMEVAVHPSQLSNRDLEELIRKLKHMQREWGPALQEAKATSKVATRLGFYGKHDRKRRSFRDYEERKHAYGQVKRNFDCERQLLEQARAELRRRQEMKRGIR